MSMLRLIRGFGLRVLAGGQEGNMTRGGSMGGDVWNEAWLVCVRLVSS